jgi:membrane-bound lytic murein transglycosylase MltF
MYFALPHGRLYFRSTILLTMVMAVFVSLLDVGLDYQTNLYAQLSYSKKLPNSAPRYHEQIQLLTSSLCHYFASKDYQVHQQQASSATRGHEDDWDND